MITAENLVIAKIAVQVLPTAKGKWQLHRNKIDYIKLNGKLATFYMCISEKLQYNKMKIATSVLK